MHRFYISSSVYTSLMNLSMLALFSVNTYMSLSKQQLDTSVDQFANPVHLEDKFADAARIVVYFLNSSADINF